MTIPNDETTNLLKEGREEKLTVVRVGNGGAPSSSSSSSSSILRLTGLLLSCGVLVHYIHLLFSSSGASMSTLSLIVTSDVMNQYTHGDIVSAAVVNPESYNNFALDKARRPFTGDVPPDASKNDCGLTCRGPNQYPFGLFACLQTAFEDKDNTSAGTIPNVVLDEDGTIIVPKVIFSPSTSFSDFELKEYNLGRQSFLNSRLPAAILYAETTDDIVRGVDCARVNGYRVSPRGRGHDYAALSSLDGTLVIDVQLTCPLADNFETDTTSPSARGAWILPGSKLIGRMKVAGGCSNGVMAAAAYKNFPKESAMAIIAYGPSVGVTGYFLNGGFGNESPYGGLGADVVDEIEIVLYNGSLITASANENEDIFWASKGGTGGLGVITNFWVRIIKSPNPSEFTFVNIDWDTSNSKRKVDQLMKFQDFLLEDPESVLYGGAGGAKGTTGVFLGSTEKAVSVFSKAGLFEDMTTNEAKPQSFTYRNGKLLCGKEDFPPCNEVISNDYPEFGLETVQVSSQAEVESVYSCISWMRLQSFPASLIGIHRSFDICRDLNLDAAKYCYTPPIPGIPPELRYNFILTETCYLPEVIEAIIKVSTEPKSFYNRKGPSAETIFFLEVTKQYPSVLALGLHGETLGMGTGGLVIPKLERKTFQGLVETDEDVQYNHFVHGAPLHVHPDSTGYPHRNAFLNTEAGSRSPNYINILLKDRAFQNDVINLQVYGNYQPSTRLPNYETHVYVEQTEELSKIRTERDPLGGFDSPRYVSRNRNKPRTIPLFSKKGKADKSSKKDEKSAKSSKKEKEKKA